jgi:ABC-type multidrug transport system ATPase subunit
MDLKLNNISFTYPGTQKPILNKITFSFQEPGFNALFGPSGVGKTSLARIISGDIPGFHQDIETHSPLPLLYTYNLERLPGWNAVGQHLKKIAPPDRQERLEDLIDSFGLQEVINSRFTRLSLGQKNRVNLIRYLLQDFHMLIMDESLANVDENTRERIILKIKAMFPQAVFLYISHNVVEVSKFCKEIVVLRNPAKTPQTRTVKGLNYTAQASLNHQELEATMLEVMNAS